MLLVLPIHKTQPTTRNNGEQGASVKQNKPNWSRCLAQVFACAAVGVASWRPLTAVVGVCAEGKAALAITNIQQCACKTKFQLQAPYMLLVFPFTKLNPQPAYRQAHNNSKQGASIYSAVVGVRAEGKAALAVTNNQQSAGKINL